MPSLQIPYPPLELANRVGSLADAADPMDYYDRLGRETREGIIDRLPSDWEFSGKRILDFGCGAGRTLRHFATEAADAELWGCDIDEASMSWMKRELCPPFHVFTNGPEPPLDQPDSSFDLIWAISVFTHLADNWSRWLVELHRILKPDGLLFVTFMGSGMSEEIAGEAWDENDFGMNVIKYGQSWDLGGPMVIHSPWWIEEHWGRAFEILSLSENGFAAKPWLDHGSVLMRKRDQSMKAADVEQIVAGDARESRALAHNVKQLHVECLELREGMSYLQQQDAEQRRLLDARTSELDRVREEADNLRQETSALREDALDLHRKTVLAQQQAAGYREKSLKSAQSLLAVEEVLVQSRARTFALEGAIEELEQKSEGTDRVMAAMQRSISWRITSPLRAFKRLLR